MGIYRERNGESCTHIIFIWSSHTQIAIVRFAIVILFEFKPGLVIAALLFGVHLISFPRKLFVCVHFLERLIQLNSKRAAAEKRHRIREHIIPFALIFSPGVSLLSVFYAFCLVCCCYFFDFFMFVCLSVFLCSLVDVFFFFSCIHSHFSIYNAHSFHMSF